MCVKYNIKYSPSQVAAAPKWNKQQNREREKKKHCSERKSAPMGRKGTTKACDTQTHRRTTHIAQQTPETISFENPFINYHHNHKHFPSLPPFNMYNATKVYVHLFMIRYLFDCLNIFSDGPFACRASMRACMCIYAECAYRIHAGSA